MGGRDSPLTDLGGGGAGGACWLIAADCDRKEPRVRRAKQLRALALPLRRKEERLVKGAQASGG